MIPPVRWGFLGAGFVATKALAPAVHAADGAVLQAVAARDAARAAALEPWRQTSSYEEVCASDDVDAVYVALPNSSHLPWVLTALDCGKHVLCEKPLGLDAGEVQAMTAAADAADCLLVEATWTRWHPRMQRLQTLIADLDRPKLVRGWFTFSGVPQDNYRLDPTRGGGALLDVGAYVVGAATMALGPEDVDVETTLRHVGPTGVDLTTEATLSNRHGLASVVASIERPVAQGLQVEAGSTLWELPDEAFTNWHSPSSLVVTSNGVRHEERFRACDPYRLMVEAVSARIRGTDAWVLPLSTSYAVAAVLDAIASADAPA